MPQKRSKELHELPELTDAEANDLFLIRRGGIDHHSARSSFNAGGGVEYFTQLLDTPTNYIGHSGKLLIVNDSETGLQYYAIQIVGADNEQELDNKTIDQGTF